MKIGIIFTGYNMADMLDESLRPWIEAKISKLEGNEYLICGLSIPFEKFNDPISDNTQDIFYNYFKSGNVDNLIIDTQPKKETEARTLALQWLVSKKIDLLIQVDADEFYTLEEIKNILSFLKKNPFIVAFKGSLKNYVFDQKTFMIKPFNPMRIHRVATHTGIAAYEFWDDNNVAYKFFENQRVLDIELPTTIIPKSIAWTKHFSWLSNERSRKKVEYQTARGWKCSFKWNYNLNKLEWNLDNLRQSGEQIPELSE